MSARSAWLKAVDAALGPALCRAAGWRACSPPGRRPAQPPSPGDLHRLLVIRPGGMGDMIVLVPVLRLLQARFPGAAVDVACERRNVEVLRLAGFAGRTLVYDDNPAAFLAALRRGRYDVALDTEQFHHFSALFAWWSRAPVRIGFKINPRRNALYTHLVNYAPDGREGEQFTRLLGPLGCTGKPAERQGCLALPGAQRDPGGRPYAVVHAGAGSRFKRWPPERFARLAAALRETCGLDTVLAGGPADRHDARLIMERARGEGGSIRSETGGATLETTARLLAGAALFVGIDSGLAHLAVALGRPAVVLFGPSDSDKWGTRDERRAVVSAATPCAPCFIFGYHKPCRDPLCMRQIRVEDVLAACRRVLAGGAPRHVPDA
jgi:ADP-heptose:LPS heptosyltransferase